MRMSVRAWLDRWGDWILACALAIVSEYEILVRPLFGDPAVKSGRAAAAAAS